MAQVRLLSLVQSGGASHGFYNKPAGDTDELLIGKVTLTGIGGVALDAGNNRIGSLAEPSASTDAATKNYVDTNMSGLLVKAPVRVATVGGNIILAGGAPNTLDGVTLVANDRILVKDQTTGSQNGIYYVSSLGTGANGTWTRTPDADASAEVKGGAYVYVNEGAANQDSAWVLTTDNPITVGTTSLTFTQFSGLGQINAGSGLTKSGNTLNVGQGDAIIVGADSLAVSYTAGEALGVNASTKALEVVLSGTTLSKVGGLKVLGVPSLFQINGVAVSANVTAANLNALTDGASVTAMHKHAAANVTTTAISGVTGTDVQGMLSSLQSNIAAHTGAAAGAHAATAISTTGIAGVLAGAASTVQAVLADLKTQIDGKTGTVTSVGLSLPNIFTVTNSPVTTSGVLTATLASQTAAYFFAAPSGAPGAPSFRAIVAGDIPTLNQNTTGQADRVANALTFGAVGGGAVAGSTFDGSAAKTISYNSIGAAPLTHEHTSAPKVVIEVEIGGPTGVIPGRALRIIAYTGNGVPVVAPASSDSFDEAAVAGISMGEGQPGVRIFMALGGAAPVYSSHAGTLVGGEILYLGHDGDMVFADDLTSGAQIVRLGYAISAASGGTMLFSPQHIGEKP